MDDGLSGVGRRSALALVGAGVSGVATIAMLIVASRALPTDGTGEFFVAISLFAIVQGLCSLGAETGLQYFIPTMTSAGARRLVRDVSIASAVAGLVVAAVVLVASGPFTSLMSEGDGDPASAERVVRLIALVLPFAGLYEITMGALRACDQVLVSTVLDRIARPIAQVLAMLVAAWLGAGSRGVVFAWALPTVIAVVVAIGLLVRVRLRNAAQRTDTIDARTFWNYTSPRMVARVAQTLLQRLDVIILAAFFPIEDVAVYGTVSRCMIAGAFIGTALRQTLQPQLRRGIVRNDIAGVKNMYGASTTWLVLVTWPVYLAMMIFAPLVMRVFGEEYVRGSSALVLLCSAMLVASACGLVDVVLLMLGRSWLSTVNVVLALVVNVVLNLLLIPSFGITGAAIAWVVAILMTNLLPLAQTIRAAGLHPGGQALWTGIALTVVTVGTPLAVGRLVFGPSLPWFLVVYAVALAAYAAGLFLMRGPVKLDQMVNDIRRRSPATTGATAA